ncbi:MAG: hypothetical protein HY561_13940, partial [Gemmatimonadetes bacterium]|nr:hypothetical protein [Gemmatimonadota bacterium]
MSRASPRLPVRHGLALAVAGLVLFAACEESELLTPSGEPAFTAISFDRATLEPEEAPLQSPQFFTAGPTQLDYSAVVNYQRTSKEVQEQGDADISYFIETFDSLLFTTPEGDKFVSFEWEGDVAEGFGEAQGATGSVQFTGKFTFPTVSTLCGSYKYARAIAVLEPELSTAYRDQAVYKIKGVPTVGEIGSCAYAFADRRDAAFAQKFYGFAFPTGPTGPSLQLRWGEPVWVYGRFFPVPRQGDPFPVGLEFGPRPGTVFPLVFREGKFSDVLAWVPVGAVSGSPRVLVSGRETKYGGNIKPSVSITPGDDYFEPNNQFGQG